MKKIKEQLGLAQLLFLIILTVGSLLVVLVSTSPIFQGLGVDCSFFLLMGNLVNEGGILYVDLFDHKGPMIFIINAFAQFFVKGPVSVWVLEVVVMSISLVILYQTAYMVLKTRNAIFIPLIYLIAMTCFMEGGNLTEEYCNLFCIIGLYIYVKFVESGYKKLSKLSIITLGILLALIVFTRINNAILLGAVVGCIGLYFIINERKRLLEYILFGLLGMLIVITPLFLYFYSQDALDDMIFGTFLFNLGYSSNAGTNLFSYIFEILGSLFGLALYAITFFGIACSVFALIKKDIGYGFFNLIYTCVAFFAACLSGQSFLHYVMIAVPVLPISFIILFKHIPFLNEKITGKIRIAFTALLVLALVGTSVLTLMIVPAEIGDPNVINAYKTDALEMAENIPEDERNSVFGYHLEPKWYVITDIIPTGRYFTMQEFMAETDETITTFINDLFENEPPKWLVLSEPTTVTNEFVQEKIETEYEFVMENSTGLLYSLK